MTERLTVAIVEVGEDYTDLLRTIDVEDCTMEQAQQIAHDLGYQVIADLCAIVGTTDGTHVVVTVEPKTVTVAPKKEERTMEQKLKEIFNLEWIRNFAEKNIDNSTWIEDGYKILVIKTLVHGAHGAYIPGMVLELFGQADGYDLEDPYNHEKTEAIYDALACLENEINFHLNQLLPSPGTYFVDCHPYDGSYCLFYEEECEEEEEEQD